MNIIQSSRFNLLFCSIMVLDMKRLMMIVFVLACLVACTRKEVENMDDVSCNGRDCTFRFPSNAGTGYVWDVVYHIDNITMNKVETKSVKINSIEDGGPLTTRFDLSVTDDNEALIIFKFARPWEGNGDYECYSITTDAGENSKLEQSSISYHKDLEHVYSLADNAMFSINILKNWTYEKDGLHFKVYPEGKDECFELFYSNRETNGTTINIYNKEFFLTEDQNIVTIEGNNICLKCSRDLYDEYFKEMIMLVDTARYEE